MSACPEDGPVLIGRIRVGLFLERTDAHQDAVREWVIANGIDPFDVALAEDVLVVLGDAPFIEYSSWLRDCNGAMMGPRPTLVTRRALLRVPLPEHLDDGNAA